MCVYASVYTFLTSWAAVERFSLWLFNANWLLMQPVFKKGIAIPLMSLKMMIAKLVRFSVRPLFTAKQTTSSSSPPSTLMLSIHTNFMGTTFLHFVVVSSDHHHHNIIMNDWPTTVLLLVLHWSGSQLIISFHQFPGIHPQLTPHSPAGFMYQLNL